LIRQFAAGSGKKASDPPISSRDNLAGEANDVLQFWQLDKVSAK
jgi:hypothetical protein